jgi:Protein of unknown function (DUF3417)
MRTNNKFNGALAEFDDIDGFDSLSELALDMIWSWNHCGDSLWRHLDPELCDLL